MVPWYWLIVSALFGACVMLWTVRILTAWIAQYDAKWDALRRELLAPLRAGRVVDE